MKPEVPDNLCRGNPRASSNELVNAALMLLVTAIKFKLNYDDAKRVFKALSDSMDMVDKVYKRDGKIGEENDQEIFDYLVSKLDVDG